MTGSHSRGQRDALVIVAKYPAPGRVKTRLGATIGFEQSARLYRAFLDDLAARFSHSALAGGYDLIWACADNCALMTPILAADARVIPQHGDDFASRLYHICCDCAALGYERTVILGSDSPQISSETVTATFDLLNDSDVVLGPAEDGGYYLVGLHNQPAPPDIFSGIVMSTAQVFDQTLERAAALDLSVLLTERDFDVDIWEDMLRLAHRLDVAPSLAPRTHWLLRTLAAGVAPMTGDEHGAG